MSRWNGLFGKLARLGIFSRNFMEAARDGDGFVSSMERYYLVNGALFVIIFGNGFGVSLLCYSQLMFLFFLFDHWNIANQ